MSDTTKCARGHSWYKKHLKDNKLYWCQFCSTEHVFTPHEIKDYAPFSSVEEALAFQKEMREQQNQVYNHNRSYWWN